MASEGQALALVPRGPDPEPSRPPGRIVAQVRGVLAERVIVSTEMDPYLTLRALASYSGLSARKLRDLLKDPVHPLPCFRIGGKLLVRRSDYDTWAARYRQVGHRDVNRVVHEVLAGLRSA